MSRHEEIRRLIALYAQLLDSRRLAEWGELFCEDASFAVWDRTYRGRNEIVKEIGGMQPPTPGKHVVLQPVIDLLDDRRARAWTDFSAFATDAEGNASIATLGRYHDELTRDDDHWRFRTRVIVFDGDDVPEGVPPAPAR